MKKQVIYLIIFAVLIMGIVLVSSGRFDFNNDGVTNIADLQALASHYQGKTAYNSTYDLNGNGKVDLFDIVSEAKNVNTSSGSGGAGVGAIDRNAILDAQYPTPVAPIPLRTFYVDAQSGSDTTGTGTSSSPWQTLTKVMSTAKAGDRFYLRGMFNDELGHQSQSPAGTALNPIEVMNWPGYTATIATNTATYPTLWLKSGMDYWWFQGLDLQQGVYTSSSNSVWTVSGSSYHTFVNNTFDSSSIKLSGSVGTRIYENKFIGVIGSQSANSGDGVFTQQGSNNDQIVRNNFNADIWHATMTIGGYQTSSDADCLNTTIVRNFINNTAAGGLDVQGKADGAIIAGNVIENTGRQNAAGVLSKTGIALDGVRNAEVYWNKVWNSQSDALKLQAYIFWGFSQLAENNHVYQNTFFDNGGCGINFVLQHNVTGLVNNTIEDNIFWKNDQTGAASYGGKSYEIQANFYNMVGQTEMWTPTDAKGNIVRNNIVANSATPDSGWLLIIRQSGDGGDLGYTMGQAESNLPGWQNNIEADPLFISESTPDFNLQSGSPGINAGRVIPGVTY